MNVCAGACMRVSDTFPYILFYLNLFGWISRTHRKKTSMRNEPRLYRCVCFSMKLSPFAKDTANPVFHSFRRPTRKLSTFSVHIHVTNVMKHIAISRLIKIWTTNPPWLWINRIVFFFFFASAHARTHTKPYKQWKTSINIFPRDVLKSLLPKTQ